MKKRNIIKLAFITWFCAILLIGICIIGVLPIDLVSTAAILLSATLALSAAVLGMYYQRQMAKEKNTLDFQQKLKEDEKYQKHLEDVRSIIHSENKDEQLLELTKPENINDPKSVSIRYVLNTWEQAANAIKHKLYDEDYLYSSHKSQVIMFSLFLRKYIRTRQRSNVALYSDFSWLSIKWALKRNSFESPQTKRELKKVFKQLHKVKTGRAPLNLIQAGFTLWFIVISVLGLWAIDNIPVELASTGAILLSATLALSAALVGMYYQRQTAKEKNTLEFQQKLKEDDTYMEHLKALSSVIHSSDREEKLIELAQSSKMNNSHSIAIRYVLNTWEQAANAISHRLFDNHYLYSSHKSLVVTFNLLLSEYISERQRTNISLYSDFCWLSDKWAEKRVSPNSRKAKRKLQQAFKQLDEIKSGKIPSDLK
ncbi:DUF4760 domain-containing protein [Pseudoalteromonas phenolica]|uniref:DUF4760 domain-containing protein n=1 Tax=Pseudoalteromonas phenolica TaxID=161398 RepID=UPI0013EEC238|nr:DUF4760 domain-containing protein [Pseudoalteromonas phenolica]